jgi:hypothetical protein
MGAITQTFLAGFETRAEHIRENEYLRLTAADRLWWDQVAKKRTSVTKREIITFLFQSAMIRDTGNGGNIDYEDIAGKYTEVENRFAAAGLRVTRAQLSDVMNGVVGGEAFDIADEWNAAIGAYMAYWPQKQITHAVKNGHTAALYTGYDGKAFFATDHPLHPADVSRGTYSNLLSGAGRTRSTRASRTRRRSSTSARSTPTSPASRCRTARTPAVCASPVCSAARSWRSAWAACSMPSSSRRTRRRAAARRTWPGTSRASA